MSATHNTFGATGLNCRSTRSVAGVIPGIRIVVFHPLAGPDARDTSGFHQPRDPLAPDPDVVLHAELGMDPRHPVHAPAPVVDLLDLLGQPRVRERPIRRRATLPVMKASPADAEHAAHHGDGIVRLLRGDQRVRLAYRPSSSLAKKTAAFRKISRSIRSVAFSSRNR